MLFEIASARSLPEPEMGMITVTSNFKWACNAESEPSQVERNFVHFIQADRVEEIISDAYARELISSPELWISEADLGRTESQYATHVSTILMKY